MVKTRTESTLTNSTLVSDVESQRTHPPSLQRTLDAIGDRTALIIKTDSDKTTLTCVPLRVEYQLTVTKSRWGTQSLTRFTRRDAKEIEDVVVAEWEYKGFGTDRLRLESSESPKDFFPAKSFLKRDGWFKSYLTFSQRFEVDGRAYIWKTPLLSAEGSMVLYSEGNDEPMAKTHGGRYIIKPRFGFIEVWRDEGILDELVVTWAIVKQRRQERAAMFSFVHTLLIDCLLFTLLHIYVWHDSKS